VGAYAKTLQASRPCPVNLNKMSEADLRLLTIREGSGAPGNPRPTTCAQREPKTPFIVFVPQKPSKRGDAMGGLSTLE